MTHKFLKFSKFKTFNSNVREREWSGVGMGRGGEAGMNNKFR